MKIVIVGASGKIGSKVVDALSGRHDIVRVGAHSGDVQCDYTNKQSIKSMYKHIAWPCPPVSLNIPQLQ